MKIVGCDLHARQQTIAMVDTETGSSAAAPNADLHAIPQRASSAISPFRLDAQRHGRINDNIGELLGQVKAA